MVRDCLLTLNFWQYLTMLKWCSLDTIGDTNNSFEIRCFRRLTHARKEGHYYR
jgi:hypothetical protein